jgi:hypothetical protein
MPGESGQGRWEAGRLAVWGSVGPTREREECGLWDGERPTGGGFRVSRTGGADSGRAPGVAMMQAADFGHRDDRAEFRRLNRPSVGASLSSERYTRT